MYGTVPAVVTSPRCPPSAALALQSPRGMAATAAAPAVSAARVCQPHSCCHEQEWLMPHAFAQHWLLGCTCHAISTHRRTRRRGTAAVLQRTQQRTRPLSPSDCRPAVSGCEGHRQGKLVGVSCMQHAWTGAQATHDFKSHSQRPTLQGAACCQRVSPYSTAQCNTQSCHAQQTGKRTPRYRSGLPRNPQGCKPGIQASARTTTAVPPMQPHEL